MDISKWGCYRCGNLKGRYCTYFGQELEKDSYCPEYKYIFEEMSFNKYQALAQRTANTKTKEEKLLNGILDLAGESGECADIVKKNMYQGHELNVEDVKDELSDVLWYIAEMATAIGVTMEDIARHNVRKLYKRYPNGFEANRSIDRTGLDE